MNQPIDLEALCAERGLRITEQRRVSARVLSDAQDHPAVEARHGAPHGEDLTASQPVVRWRLADGRRLAAAAQLPNKSGTPVNLTIEKLADASAMEAAKAEIEEILGAVAD